MDDENIIQPIEEQEPLSVLRAYRDGSCHDGDIEKGITEIEKEREEKQEKSLEII